MEDQVIMIVIEESKSYEPIKQRDCEKKGEVQIIATKESKSADLANMTSDCEKSTGDQIIAIEESKLSDPTNPIGDCEKSREDQNIAMEESKSSDPANPKKYKNNTDQERLMKVSYLSIGLCLIMIIFPATSNHDYIATHHTLLTIYHTAFVLVFQLPLFGLTLGHPVNNSIFGVLYMLLISSTITVIEVALVTRTAAIIILITWMILIGLAVCVNWKVINSAASKTFLKFIAVICVISLLFTINCIVHTLSALLYRSA